jgi:hypothetical protein
MDNNTAGSTIDNKVADLEAALRTILAVTADTDQSAVVTLVDGDTTPSISGGHRFLTANTGATSITDFDNEVNGKVIFVLAGDANTTIVHGATIILKYGINVTLAANDVIAFYCSTSVWYEIARSCGVQPPGAVISRSTDQSVNNNSTTAIQFTSEDLDNGAFCDLGAQATRITIPTGLDGWYQACGRVQGPTGNAGVHVLSIHKNGSEVWRSHSGQDFPQDSDMGYSHISIPVSCAAADYLELKVFHLAGSAQNFNPAEFSARLIYLT